MAAAKHFGATDRDCEQAVRNYKGIEHRMEKVGTFCGITFYNDCIATIPHAVLCAVDALKTVDTLIVGGKDRGCTTVILKRRWKRPILPISSAHPTPAFPLCAP